MKDPDNNSVFNRPTGFYLHNLHAGLIAVKPQAATVNNDQFLPRTQFPESPNPSAYDGEMQLKTREGPTVNC